MTESYKISWRKCWTDKCDFCEEKEGVWFCESLCLSACNGCHKENKQENNQEIGVFDHPYVPALIIIAWVIGFIMGLLMIKVI